MKKLLFAAYDMNVGGIETALITLLNYFADKKYKITLVLEKKQGTFLNDLDKRIDVITYTPCECKNVIIRKMRNLLKKIEFTIKYKNKYDFAASFATYSKSSSFVARTASKNNALWGHADYLELFKNNENSVKEFFNSIQYNKFKKIIFVSKAGMDNFIKIFPEMKEKVNYCNNLIDYNKIEQMSNEEIEYKRNVYTFVNVGRHDEIQKRLTRIIEAAKMLDKDKMQFKILLIGEGKDTNTYKKMVKDYNLKEKIEFVGLKKNPYPYIKASDSVILTSDYEGYPVVYTEALILNKPILTTDVSAAEEAIKDKYGIIVPKDAKALYEAMKSFIINGYIIKQKFNAEEYNNKTIKKLEELF